MKTDSSVQSKLQDSMENCLDKPPDQTKRDILRNSGESPIVDHSKESSLSDHLDELTLAGTIIHLRSSSTVGIFTAGLAERIHFLEVYLSSDMIYHHFPNKYEDSFEQLLPDPNNKGQLV